MGKSSSFGKSSKAKVSFFLLIIIHLQKFDITDFMQRVESRLDGNGTIAKMKQKNGKYISYRKKIEETLLKLEKKIDFVVPHADNAKLFGEKKVNNVANRE